MFGQQVGLWFRIVDIQIVIEFRTKNKFLNMGIPNSDKMPFGSRPTHHIKIVHILRMTRLHLRHVRKSSKGLFSVARRRILTSSRESWEVRFCYAGQLNWSSGLGSQGDRLAVPECWEFRYALMSSALRSKSRERVTAL